MRCRFGRFFNLTTLTMAIMANHFTYYSLRLAWVSILAVVTSEEVMEDEGDELEETISNSESIRVGDLDI